MLIVLSGDSILPGGLVEVERRIGTPEQVTRLREGALSRAREAALGWRAADPDAPRAVGTLADTYLQMRQPDSALAVLEEAQRRPAMANTASPRASR
jgi:hypothetical protein